MLKRLAIAATLVAACLPAAAVNAQQRESITIDLPNDAATLDPHLQWDTDSYSIYRNIFDKPRDPRQRGQDRAPGRRELETDRRHDIEFTIRKGIKFHDGSSLTAEDVAFSIRRIIDPAFRSPQLSQFDQIASAEHAGDKVLVKTKAPYPALMAQLVKLSIVPKAVVERMGAQAFNQAPVGSGPYKLKSAQRGVATVMEAVQELLAWSAALRRRNLPGGPGCRDAHRGFADGTRRHRPATRAG